MIRKTKLSNDNPISVKIPLTFFKKNISPNNIKIYRSNSTILGKKASLSPNLDYDINL